jgi:hypothetical protein
MVLHPSHRADGRVVARHGEAHDDLGVERQRLGHLDEHARGRDVAGHVPLIAELLGRDLHAEDLVDTSGGAALLHV